MSSTDSITAGDTIEVLRGNLKGRRFVVATATPHGRISFDFDGTRAWTTKDAVRKVAAEMAQN